MGLEEARERDEDGAGDTEARTFFASVGTLRGLASLSGLRTEGEEPGVNKVNVAAGDLLYFFFTSVEILILSLVAESFLVLRVLGVFIDLGVLREGVCGVLMVLGVGVWELLRVFEVGV